MKAFDRLPIGRKLTVITAITITVALLLTSSIFLAYDRLTTERTIARRIRSQAETVAFNAATALVFSDPESAARTLSALRSDSHVLWARIYKADNDVFAEYARQELPANSVLDGVNLEAPDEDFTSDALTVRLPVIFEGKPYGWLVVRTDLLERDERFRAFAMIVGGTSVLALAVALTFGRFAQRVVSDPILDLAAAARRIGEHNDFSVRPKPVSDDEVGALVVAFNRMLDSIERQDRELRTTHEELEARIREADEANRLKDEFLATLSHELRTPLNAILGWAQILKRGGLEPEAVDRALETISRNALAQGQIIADILDMQRIVAGKLRLNLEPLDVSLVLRRAIDTVNPAARSKEIEIVALVDADAGPVLGDPDRLQQVMWNLLSNAVKFTPKGGRVRVGLRKVDSHLEIAIEDTGSGLDPAFIPFAFDRFRQADSSSTRRHGGLGLGLAIVKNLVELHGGSVSAGNRTTGAGALFVVRLPRMSVRPSAPSIGVLGRYPEGEPDVPLARAPELHGIRVLVVDDEADSREITAMALGRCGADVAVAASAEEAVAVLRRTRPHVLLSDIEMPGEDGYSLIRRIRQLGPQEGGLTPAAALTAYAGTEDRMRALAAGFQIHVPKPVQPAELAAVIASLARGVSG